MTAPWTLTAYEKIAEAPEKWGLDEAGHRALGKTPWVVTEKIHGANFCLVTDGTEVLPAKRKELLLPHEDFFGHRVLVERLEGRALAEDVLEQLRDDREEALRSLSRPEDRALCAHVDAETRDLVALYFEIYPG